MADEALACFNSLLENVPGWIADLESILKSAAERQEEILFANQPEEPDVVPSSKRPKSKSSSLKSRRSADDRVDSRQEANKAGLLSQPQFKHLTNSDALRLSQRKRKTASVCSGDQSGPSKFRTKAAAVVYYDGETQKQFEKLVRTVGSTRNSIRKGKMSAKVDSLSRSGSSGSEASSSSSDENVNSITGKPEYRTPRVLRGIRGGDGTEVFDKVDSRLEKGQGLCERAAHQVLRDGDCTLEVSNAKEHFAEALKMAEAEIPNLQKKADKVAERRRRSEERRRAEEEEAEQKRLSQLSETIKNAVSNVIYPGEGKLEVDHLEVDDESDDEEGGEFDLGDIQFGQLGGKFGHMRSSRLAAH